MLKIIARAYSLVTGCSKSLLEFASGHLSTRHHCSSMLRSSFGVSWRSKSLIEPFFVIRSIVWLEHALFVLRSCVRYEFQHFPSEIITSETIFNVSHLKPLFFNPTGSVLLPASRQPTNQPASQLGSQHSAPSQPKCLCPVFQAVVYEPGHAWHLYV